MNTSDPASGNQANEPVSPVFVSGGGNGISFPDRRHANSSGKPVIERRQFANSHSELSDEARQLGQAIDQYKLVHRRRFITYEEMLSVIKSLGYRLEG